VAKSKTSKAFGKMSKGVSGILMTPVNAVLSAPSALKKTATAKNAKSYAKVAGALTVGGIGYAAVQESIKGVNRTLIPANTAARLEWNLDNGEVGLAAQTLMLIASTNMASKALKDTKMLSTAEAKIAANAGMGFAVGRHLMGTSFFDIGKRFEYLMDGSIGAALFPGRGPPITTPSNAAASAQVVTMSANQNFSVNNNYLDNRVDRGMPYLAQQGSGTRIQLRNNTTSPYQAPSNRLKAFTMP
jgi:hypothetical protein